ncbi:hypothetical protein AMATHDRAFT_46256 [Amanita thiersii Skay4041]|uniref:DNA-directed DNA polymerase n=1 Tax=Amanita thiersii Skay4041 TaxID=703135 RepID=A0A2A9NX06_9AGAR|nr:hypothetical protein AMATHDRAFT_46256 [Amanita thiersii Skay4041]
MRASTTVIPPDILPSFVIESKDRSYKHQYANIYFVRLRLLRQVIEKRATRLWGAYDEKPIAVPRVLEVVKEQFCYIIGTVYMDMPLKPNVVEEIARDHSIPPPPPLPKYYSEDDSVMLEDESGRIKLVGECLKYAHLVTGVVVGALGAGSSSGDFEVLELCFPEFAPHLDREVDRNDMDIDSDGAIESLEIKPRPYIVLIVSAPDEWIAVVSGLNVGLPSLSETTIDMLSEFLTGEAGAPEDQAIAAQISRLIVAGNSLANASQYMPKENSDRLERRTIRRRGQNTVSLSPHPILNLTSHLRDIGQTMPIHILPGENDPSGVILPQQPFPRAMFGEASRTTSFYCETNPTYLRLKCDRDPATTRTLLINSGQLLDDIFKYLQSPPNTRLSVLESTLKWRHIAPTAPDTLWCHPYFSKDPFVVKATPDIYIVGCQRRFGTKLVTRHNADDDNVPQRCRIILVPNFSETGILVLVNLRNLEVKTIHFTIEGKDETKEDIPQRKCL